MPAFPAFVWVRCRGSNVLRSGGTGRPYRESSPARAKLRGRPLLEVRSHERARDGRALDRADADQVRNELRDRDHDSPLFRVNARPQASRTYVRAVHPEGSPRTTRYDAASRSGRSRARRLNVTPKKWESARTRVSLGSHSALPQLLLRK